MSESLYDKLGEERIDKIADFTVRGMEDGVRGFMKTWGWQQFARELLKACAMEQQIEPMDMALCEIHRVVIRPGQLYTFSRVGDCEKCAALEREAIEAYEPVGITPINRPAARHQCSRPGHPEACENDPKVGCCYWRDAPELP